LIRQIVCALDVLRPSRAALRHAFEVAERFNALLDIVYARPPSPAALTGFRTSGDLGATTHEKLRKIVAGAVTPIQGRANLHVLADEPVAAILSHAARTRCDLIVLGSCPDEIPDEQRAKVADRLAAAARCAVMTSNEWSWADPPGIKRVLLPVGSKPFTPSPVVDWAATLAWHFDAKIELLHVLPPASEGDEATQPVRRLAEDRLARWKEYLNGRGVSVSDAILVAGHTASRIIERAELSRSDLIVLAAPSAERDLATPGLVAEIRRSTGARVLSVRREAD
jgi:nucleotide-binding universal stress UspA family protein